MKKISAGFSFVELIVAATILGMVVFAGTSTLPTTVKSFRVEQEVASDTIDARNIVEIVRATGFSSLRDMCVSLATFDVVKETLSCTLHVQLTPQARLLASGSEASPTVQFHFWKANESGQLSGIASKDELVGFGGATFADFVVRIPGNNGVETTLASSIAQFDGMDEAYNIGVFGFVRNEGGEPIPHPQIEFTSHDTGEQYRPQTGQDGYYHFPTGIPKGEYRVFIEKEHHQDILHGGISFDETTEQNYILRRLYTLRGRVTDERAGIFGGSYPVSGATVSVSGGPSVQTDSDGYYEIKGLLAGPNGDPQNYSITVSKDGGWVSKAEGVAIGSKPHPYHQLDFILDYRIRVDGVVKDHNGNAVGGAKVELSPGGKFATTGIDGSFTINDVIPGIYTATASKEGYELHRLNDVRIENNPHTLAFTLDGRVSLTGSVSGYNNASLSGVSVTLYRGSQLVSSKSTSGSFSFEGLEPAGDYRLVVQKQGFKTVEEKGIATSYPSKDAGTFTLLPNVVLNAKDATTGSDVSNLKVMLGSTKSTSTSGATHTFEAVVPGTYTLDIQDNRSTPAYYQSDKPSRQSISVSAQNATSVNATVYRYDILGGRVTDSNNNRGIADATVTLFEDGAKRSTTRTNASGDYMFDMIRHDRSYTVSYTHPDYEPLGPMPPKNTMLTPKKKRTVVYVNGTRYESDDRVIRDAVTGFSIHAVKEGTGEIHLGKQLSRPFINPGAISPSNSVFGRYTGPDPAPGQLFMPTQILEVEVRELSNETHYVIYDGEKSINRHQYVARKNSSPTTGSWADIFKQDEYIQIQVHTYVLASLFGEIEYSVPVPPNHDYATLNIEWSTSGQGSSRFSVETSMDSLLLNTYETGYWERKITSFRLGPDDLGTLNFIIRATTSGNNNKAILNIYRIWLSDGCGGEPYC